MYYKYTQNCNMQDSSLNLNKVTGMRMDDITYIYLLVLVQASIGLGFQTLDHIVPTASIEHQEEAASALISRVISSRAAEFSVTIDHIIGPPYQDTFELFTEKGTLHVVGTSGVAVAWGFYYYLSQYCSCHISWAGDQLTLPDVLPVLLTPVRVTSNDRFRYYQNVCTVSYSFAWWNWTRWEREIDWMAMNGINLPLAFSGQEAIWQRVYSNIGLTQQEIDQHFAGPAFLAWSRMGNIQGWGGPLPATWHQQQVALQHKILARMRSLGMTPVLPAFAGHVPDAIERIFPQVNVSRLGHWGHFGKPFCCTLLLDPLDPLFTHIGQSFLAEYIKEFGTDHVYNADTFNEMTPKSSSPSYLQSVGKAVYDAMLAGDNKAIWLMQGWLFLNPFWQAPQAKALLTSVPKGHMIVLDLFAEVSPLYLWLNSYYGQPFIWCMLHNFGGTMAMYGAIDTVNEGPAIARAYPNSTMVGIGLTPEGINQNNVMYEFMLENSWRPQPRNVSQWMSNYTVRRYGVPNANVDEAWQILKETVYSCSDGQKHHNKNLIVHRPSKKNKIDKGIYNCTTGYMNFATDVILVRRPRLVPELHPDIWYDPLEFFHGWDLFIEAARRISIARSPLFRYDVVDVTRQALQVTAILYYSQIMTAYKAKDIDNVLDSGKRLLDLLSDLDALLATDDHFLLGRWLESSKALAASEAEKKLYEFNARAQITTWGPTGEILDYANKQWAGLVQSYYRPRWEMFVLELIKSVLEEKSFNQSRFNEDVFVQVELPFILDRTIFATTTTGDQIERCIAVHRKYRTVTSQHALFFRQLPRLSRKGKRFTKRITRWMNKISQETYPSYNSLNQVHKYR